MAIETNFAGVGKPRRKRLVAILVVTALLASGLASGDMPVSNVAAPKPPPPLGGCLPGGGSRIVSANLPSVPRAPAHRTVVTPRAAGGEVKTLAHDGVELAIGAAATARQVEIGITPLSEADLPDLGAGMTNVTKGPRRGYRFTPHPYKFEQDITVSMPYDPTALKSAGMTAQDVRTFFFDEPTGCWRALERTSVDERKHLIVSRTDHFTDMVNATVTAPEGPEQVSFDPTEISGIQAANPATGLNLINPPAPNNTGDARLSYPLEVPKGRAGLQPGLAVQYSSDADNGWLGLGWNLATPAITVDTRWGVPRYDAQAETETYLIGGQQLAPVAHRGERRPRAADKVFHTRVEGSFARIVRRGDSPSNYTWEVTDKSGVRSLYGGESSTLADDSGNIFSWALREVRDRNDNVMRYQHVRQDDGGVEGSAATGRDLYLQKITYTGRGDTDGPYTVTFTRDRELDEPRRADVTIDARGGFERITADLLRRVEVRLNDEMIRRYEFGYEKGAFNKTLLKSIAQYGEDGKLFNTHEFGYFDDIRDAQGEYQAFTKVDWTSPDDNVRNGTVDAVRPGAGEAGALNGNTSTGAGAHLYVGYGVSGSKSGSVGIKTGYSQGSDEGLLALMDVDGDNLPDKVFKDGGGVAYRKNLSKPGGEPRFAAEAKPLRNLPGILSESSSSRTLGVEGYAGGAAAQLDHVDTFTRTERYFSDVNADGISDLVNGGTVLFGRVGDDGVPVYGVAGDTPVPIGSAPVDPDGLLGDYAADRERRIDSFPLVDSVRRWEAPYDGTVQITGPVQLAEDTGQLPDFVKPDGVRVAVQHEDRELWSRAIAASDHGSHAPENVDAVQVRRGDHLYFRVGSRFDGASDRVSWDPQITYAAMAAATDANGLPVHQFTASRDFTLAGRSAKATAPVDGTLHLTGALTKKAATSDDITVVITRANTTVFEKKVAAGDTGEIPVDAEVPVTKGQELAWRVKVDSPIDLGQLDWTPSARYTSAEGTAELTGKLAQDERFELAFQPPYDIDTYPVSDAATPAEAYTAPQAGTLTVSPHLTVDAAADGRVVFTVKKQGALLGKKVIEISGGQVPEDVRVPVEVAAGDRLFFDFSVADPALAAKVTEHSVTADGAAVPSTVHRGVAEGSVFARPYRGWAVVGYNGNRDRAEQPIKQSDLAVTDDIRDQLPDSIDPPADRDEFEADPRIKPPNVIIFAPQPEQRRWGSGEFSWVAGSSVSSSRMGGESIGLPAESDLAEVTAVPRMSRTKQTSLTGSVGGGVGSIGGSVAFGTSTGELDYVDMNADGFPDVVGSGGIQYTDPTGALGGTRAGLPGGSVRESENTVGNANAGSAARTIATGRGQAAPPASGTANTSQSGNDMPPLGIGGNLGSGDSDGKSDLLDINGDALPDRVYEDGRAALNLGYRFAAPKPWGGGALNDGSTENRGLNIGFNTDFYGLAGGASLNQGTSSTKNSLMDVNGDGLADRVFEGSPIKVALNTGGGFAAPVPFHGSLPGINSDSNAKLGGGAYFTIPICFIVGCLIINPGADVSTGASRAEQALRDIDGDGFADHLASEKDSELTVAQNRTGRTNLLRTVTRPLGAKIDLDYERSGNTYDQPQSQYVLSKVRTSDGVSGDGPEAQTASFRYSGGVYDRLDREFLGYGTVVEEHRDGAGDDAGVYRKVTSEYRTDGFYTRGLLKRERAADASGAVYTDTETTYVLRDVATGEEADGRSTTATIFPQAVRTDSRFHEGGAEAVQSTRTEMAYDEYGNLVRSTAFGDAGPEDDVETKTRFTECADTYIVGVADGVEVRGGGKLMRERESTVDCATGDVTRHVAKVDKGDDSVTDLTYHDDGNLKSVTSPANHRGQRYRTVYDYDPVTATYVTSTTDSFGYRSTASYDLKYGRLETSVDINDQRLSYAYDAFGRVDSVTGPYEKHEKTIDFEYHPEEPVPYAVTRHIDRESDGSVKADTIDMITFADGLGRVVQAKKDATLGEGSSRHDAMIISGRTVYDAFGRAVKQYYPTSEPKGPANTTFNTAFDEVPPTTSSYDVLDRVTRTVLPDETATTNSYGFGADRAGVTRFETVVKDAGGVERRSYRDVRDLITSVRETGAKDGAPPIWTSYAYDPLSQITKVADDRGNTTTSTYDDLGRRTSVHSPDTGKTTTVYDPAGNTVREITANLDKRNKAISYSYDFNRLEEIDYPTFEKNDVKYYYGGPGAHDNAAGRVTKVKDSAGEVYREYGPLGELVEEKRTLPGFGPFEREFTTKYRYDNWGRVLRMTFPDGEELSYGYNSGGLVDSATGHNNGFTYKYLKRLDYDEFEQRVSLEMGNGTRTRYDYDAQDRRLATQESKLPTGYAFQNLSYGYDTVGNVTSVRNDTEEPGPRDGALLDLGGPSEQTFSYDRLYRLTGATGEYTVEDGLFDKRDHYRLSMSYDTLHNITAKDQRHEISLGRLDQVQRDTTYSNAYAFRGGRPHAPSSVGSEDMTYDANGNLVDREKKGLLAPRRQMIWDEENRLACVNDTAKFIDLPQDPSACDRPGISPSVRFQYDDQGSRVVKDGLQTTLYPNQGYTARGLTEFKHVFVGKTRLATKISGPGRFYEKDQFYYHGDQLGSTGFGTDDDGRLTEHLNYFPTGETWIDEGPGSSNPYQFTGKELDPETGYYNYGARYYDPKAGLWQSADPIMGTYLDGQGNEGVYNSANLNAYGYAHQNPARLSDPDGKLIETAWDAVSLGMGLYSLKQNWQEGNYWSAALDTVGVVVDGAALVTPFVPGGVGAALKAGRAGGSAAVDAANAARGSGAAADATKGLRQADPPASTNPCKTNSFTPDTEVVMADGTRRPIGEIKIGDKVLATDPEDGQAVAKPVTDVITGSGEKELVKVSVDVDGDKGGKTASVTATDGHPFWVDAERQWVDAGDLKPGMWLRTSAGTLVQITAVKAWTARQQVHNLTVDDIHTYYVNAGAQDLLVHNCQFSDRAREIHDAEPSQYVRNNVSTVSVIRVDTPDGVIDVVTGAGDGLTAAQKAALRPGEKLAENITGIHAEPTGLATVVDGMANHGWNPIAGGTSRNICNNCAEEIRDAGAKITGPLYPGNGKTTTRQRSFEW